MAQTKGGTPEVVQKKNLKPKAQEVIDFHTNSDKDGSPKAIHHTLGPGPNQAAAGNHSHDGGNSAKGIIPLDGLSLTGSRSGGAALTSVIAALVQLGATDNTTP